MKTFAERLNELRETHNLTAAQAARELRVPTQTYLRHEKGLSKRGFDFLIRVAQFYNVSVDYLLGLGQR